MHAARAFEALGRQARDEKCSFEDYLQEVLAVETTSRRDSAVKQRVHDARLPEMKTLDPFDFAISGYRCARRRSHARWLARVLGEHAPCRTDRHRQDTPRDRAVSVAPDPSAEQIPGAHCWNGLLDADQAASIATLRDVLARALASGDELLARYVGDRLAEVIGADVGRAAELLQWLATTSGREAEIGFDALPRTAAVRDPSIARALLRLGEDRAGDTVRRASAIASLETQTRLPPDDLGRVVAVALNPNAPDVAWTATRTLGRVMKEDFTRTGDYAPYMTGLLEVSKRTTEPAVRLLALEMPAHVDPIIGTEYIDDFARLLRTAPERELREIAAFQLGLTRDPQRVLSVFRAAFPLEPELCVRWAMIRFAVRAAGPRALPLLAELARIDRRFDVDVEDFRRIYATGLGDFERVWLEKTEHIHARAAAAITPRST